MPHVREAVTKTNKTDVLVLLVQGQPAHTLGHYKRQPVCWKKGSIHNVVSRQNLGLPHVDMNQPRIDVKHYKTKDAARLLLPTKEVGGQRVTAKIVGVKEQKRFQDSIAQGKGQDTKGIWLATVGLIPGIHSNATDQCYHESNGMESGYPLRLEEEIKVALLIPHQGTDRPVGGPVEPAHSHVFLKPAKRLRHGAWFCWSHVVELLSDL